MNISQLQKLSSNPHYKLSPAQLAALETHRVKQVKHDPTIKKHGVRVVKHSPKVEDENGTR